MYPEMLEALFARNGANNDYEKKSYLQSLQEPSRQLWSSYRNDLVSVDYSDLLIQAAYFLRYFPQYTELIYQVLTELSDRNIHLSCSNKRLKCLLFGSGCCPEAYGVVKFVEDNQLDINDFRFISLDIHAEGWAFTRSINKNDLLRRLLQNKRLILSGYKFDICEPLPPNYFNSGIPDLIVFQNCLNEVSYNAHDQVLDNLSVIYDRLSQNAMMIFIDLSRYQSTRDILLKFEERISQKNELSIISSFKNGPYNYDAYSIINAMPKDLTEYFLDGTNKLIPRRYLRYQTLIVRK